MNHVQANAAQTKDNRAAADLDLGGIDHSTDARRDAATDIANLVKRRVFADLGQRDFRHNRVVGKGRAAHVVMDGRAIKHRETGRTIWQKPGALGAADLLAKVGFGIEAILALTALRRVKRDHVITDLKAGNTFADLNDNACALMAKDRRKNALRVIARAGEFVCVA